MNAINHYEPLSTLLTLQEKIENALSTPTMKIWDSPAALEMSSQATLVSRFEELQEQENNARENLLRAAMEASVNHWSHVYWLPEPAMKMAIMISAWIDNQE